MSSKKMNKWNALKQLNVLRNLELKAISSALKNTFNMVYQTTGLCEGEVRRNLIEAMIEKQTNISNCTLGEFHQKIAQGKPFKTLHFYSLKIGKEPELIRFSSDDVKWKDLILSDLFTAVTATPMIFKPRTLYFKDRGMHREDETFGSYMSAELIYDFPIDSFDFKRYIENGLPEQESGFPIFNRRTLGLSFSSVSEGKNNSIVKTAVNLIKGIVNSFRTHEAIRNNPYNANRVIDLNNDENKNNDS